MAGTLFFSAGAAADAAGFPLGRGGGAAYKRPTMTRKQIDVSVYVFLILLIAAFVYAVWGVLGMIGVVG